MLRRLILIVFLLGLSLAAHRSACADDDDPQNVFHKYLDSGILNLQNIEKQRKERRKKALDKAREEEEEEKAKKDDAQANPNADLKSRWMENFQDTDFSHHSFDDLRLLDQGKKLPTSDPGWVKNPDKDPDKDAKYKAEKKDDDFMRDVFLDYKKDHKLDELRTFKDILKPVAGALHDWVPSDPDDTANGSFELGAFNGSPVPYRLNGWVKIERKLPWEAEP